MRTNDPICCTGDARQVLASLPRLSEIDGLAVSLEERATALAMWADLDGLDDDDACDDDERAPESTGTRGA